jgi:zinc protease
MTLNRTNLTEKLKRVVLSLSLAGLGFLSGCASSPKALTPPSNIQAEQIPLVGAYKVSRFTLPNGLRLLVVEDHSSPTFSYQTWFRVGSRNEVPGRTGLAHLFEHMMFKETSHYKEGQFDRMLEEAGAEGENAFTSWDYTAYVQELPKAQLDLIAKLESDRMVNLEVNENAFKTEREVVQNERRFRNENSPSGTLWQELFGLAYQVHPYHWPVIGYQADLEAMTAEDARSFYKSYYCPNHATVVVSGDVSPNEVLATVQKYYGHLTPENPAPHDIPQEPEQTSARRKQVKLNIQVEKLMMAYHVPSVISEDDPALNVLEALLTGGKSARLRRALVDTGIASSAEASMLEMKDPGLFVLEVNLQKGKRATQAEAVVLREIQRLGKRGVGPTELERAKNRQDFYFYSGLDSNSERTSFLGRYEALAGNFEEGIKVHQKVRSVTSDDIVRVIHKYFSPKNRTVVTGVVQ